MKRLIKFFIPPKIWQLPALIITGAIAGLSLYALVESKSISYLSDNPQTCANCHVMTPQYVTWSKSSHKKWANCNDCHVPQDNILKKYAAKAADGLYHASVFTARLEPEVIMMREGSAAVVQNNCIRCHQDQVTDAKLSGLVEKHFEMRTERKCWECHQEVPHGKVRSLSSVKYYGKIPEEHYETIPSWLKTFLNDTIK